jgi:hypothetical protein
MAAGLSSIQITARPGIGIGRGGSRETQCLLVHRQIGFPIELPDGQVPASAPETLSVHADGPDDLFH